jgi:hypothetical protein
VNGTDFDDLAGRVKQRLDEVFADSTPAGRKPEAGREALAPALSRLERITGRLKWKIPLEAVRAYAAELARLRRGAAGDRILLLLIQIQSELCRYILARRRKASLEAPLLLLKAFRCMRLLIGRAGPRSAGRRQRFQEVLSDYQAFRASLASTAAGVAGARAKGAARRCMRPARGVSEAPAPGPQAYFLVPVDDAMDLKTFIRAEFDRLRAQLSARPHPGENRGAP